MSRNRIEMSKALFEEIFAAAKLHDPSFSSDDKVRWIKRLSAEDAEFMASADVEVLPLGTRALASSIRYETERYFCFVGLNETDAPIIGLQAAAPTPGLFSSVAHVAALRSIATASQVRDVLEGQYMGVADYDGHDLFEVMKLFPAMRFVKGIRDDLVYLDDIRRVTGVYYLAGYQDYPLNLGKETRDALSNLFLEGDDCLPYHVLLQACLSNSWAELFLCLYRAIEQLYCAPRLNNLLKNISHSGTASDLAEILENVLSWRPREEEALSSLLGRTSAESRAAIFNAIVGSVGNLDIKPEVCASHIYKLRNSHVHFRPAMKAQAMSDKSWNSIVLAMCDILAEVYMVFGTDFLTLKRD